MMDKEVTGGIKRGWPCIDNTQKTLKCECEELCAPEAQSGCSNYVDEIENRRFQKFQHKQAF